MISSYVDTLDIKNVVQSEFIGVSPGILFEIGDFQFYMTTVKLENGKHYPNAVYHRGHKKRFKTCDYCGLNIDKNVRCSELEYYKDELFQRLITFNSIRMYWLYLDHEE